LSHLKVTPIELLNSDSVPWRRAREAYWQLTLGTLFPMGLNNFPIHLEPSFKSFEIISATDLANFWNLACLQSDDDPFLSTLSPLPIAL